MTEIYNGKRYDIGSDKTIVHVGTKTYLQMIGAKLNPTTLRQVPDDWLDGNGKLVRQNGAVAQGS